MSEKVEPKIVRKPAQTVGSVTIGSMTESEAQEGWTPQEAEAVLRHLAFGFASKPAAQKKNRAATIIHPAGAETEVSVEALFQPDGIITTDDKGKILSFNDAAAKMFGYTSADVLGKPVTDLVAGAVLNGASAGKLTARRRGGVTFSTHLSSTPVVVGDNKIYVLALRDLADLQRRERERRKSEVQYSALVNQIPAVTFSASLEGGLNEIYIGPQIEALLGFSQKHWLEQPFLWFKQLHPDDQERWNAEFTRGCATGGPFRADCRFYSRDGRIVWVHGEATVVRDGAGSPIFIHGVAFDITDVKAAEEKMREAQESLVRTEKLAALGQLAASVGHELRNPLAAIRNAWFFINKTTEMTTLRGADKRVSTFSDIIQSELGRCGHIIGELLDFARGRAPYLEPTPILSLLNDAVSVVVKPAPTIQVTVEVATDVPVANLDAQFRQVIVNLTQNAVEAVNPKTGVVQIKSHAAAGMITIEVSDNGAGMPPAVQARVFEPLYTTKTRGTGLGLAVVAGIVKSHSGQITVKSELGKGTTFTVRFPVGTASQGAKPDEGGAADFR